MDKKTIVRYKVLIILMLLLMQPANTYSFPYGSFDVKVNGTVTESYNDNITSTVDMNNKKEDFITNLTLGADVTRESQTHNLVFSGRITQQLFADNSELDRNSQNLSLKFSKEFTMADRLNLFNDYTHAYEAEGFQNEFGRTAGRYSSYHNNLGLEYLKNLTKDFSLSAKYSNNRNWYSKEELKDSESNSMGIDADYSLSLDTTLGLSYSYKREKIEDGKKSSTQTVSLGMKYNITKQLYADGKIGIDYISGYNEKTYKQPLVIFSLTDEIDYKTKANFSYTKQYSSSSDKGDIFDSWQASALLKRAISAGLDWSLSGFYGMGEYDSTEMTEELLGAGISFTYKFADDVRGNLVYNYLDTEYTTPNNGTGYTKNTTLIGLTVEF